MESNRELSAGIQKFEDIIRGGLIYVDKTAYLANMIGAGIKSWFLARPRRFGKSLNVSTFEAIFSGQKGLFKGLAIENDLARRGSPQGPSSIWT